MVIKSRPASGVGHEFEIRREDTAIRIKGDLKLSNAERFEHELLALSASESEELILDLSGLDIADGVSLAVAVNTLRELRTRCRRLVIKGASQVLRRGLDREHDLQGPSAIEWVELRGHEPHG